MALQNPSALYTGGAVSLNPLSYVNIALRARAMKQAKDEAIDNYYRKLPDTLNDKGIRDQEIPLINDSKNKMSEYWMKNKEALKNSKIDGGAAQLGYQKLYREAQALIRDSQNAAKEDLEVGKMILSKDGSWAVDDDEFLEANRKHNLSVRDKEYSPYDMPKLLSNKPFDLKTYGTEVKTRFKYGTGTPTVMPHPQDPTLEVVITNPVLDETTKQGIYDFAAQKVHNSRKFQKEILKMTPEQLLPLNELSIRTFGHPLREDFKEEDIAAALAVSQMATTATQTKTIPSISQRQQNAKDMQEDRQRFAEYMAGVQDRYIRARAKDGVTVAEASVGWITEDVANKYGEDVPTTLNGKTVTRRVIFTDKADKEELRFITKGVKPVPINITDEKGNVTARRFGYYYNPGNRDWEGENGQPISAERARRDVIDNIENTKFKAGQNQQGRTNTPTKESEQLDPAGFKKEGKYWKYKDGRLFDDKGNVIKK